MKKIAFLTSIMALICLSALLTKVLEPCGCINSNTGPQIVSLNKGLLKTIFSCTELAANPFLKNGVDKNSGLDSLNNIIDDWQFLFQESGVTNISFLISDKVDQPMIENDIWVIPEGSKNQIDITEFLEKVFISRGNSEYLAKWKAQSLVKLRGKSLKAPLGGSLQYWGKLMDQVTVLVSPIERLKLISNIAEMNSMQIVDSELFVKRGRLAQYEKAQKHFLEHELGLSRSVIDKVNFEYLLTPVLNIYGQEQFDNWVNKAKQISKRVSTIIFFSCEIPKLQQVSMFEAIRNLYFIKTCDKPFEGYLEKPIEELLATDIEYIHFIPKAVKISLEVFSQTHKEEVQISEWREIFFVAQEKWDIKSKRHLVKSAIDGILSYRLLDRAGF